MPNSSILILNGPGLRERRDPSGGPSLADIEQQCLAKGEQLGLAIDFRQSDEITELARLIVHERSQHSALIINPVSYADAPTTDTGLLVQALQLSAAVDQPVIEVHLRNTFLPDSTIKHPLLAVDSHIAFIAGLGAHSYLLALNAIQQQLAQGATS